MVRLAIDHGLIGDGRVSALVAQDSQMPVPAPNGSTLFDFSVTPEGLRTSQQYYLPDTCVLVTEMHCATGVVEVADTFTLPTDLTPRGELLRYVRVLQGHAVLRLDIHPQQTLEVDRHGGALRFRSTGPGETAGATFAFRQIGLTADADHVLGEALDALENTTEPASHAEFLDCAYQWAHSGGSVHDVMWNRLVTLANAATATQSGTRAC